MLQTGTVNIFVGGAGVPEGDNYNGAIIYQNGTLTITNRPPSENGGTGGDNGGSSTPPLPTAPPAATPEPIITPPAATEVPAQITTPPTTRPSLPTAGAGTVLDPTPEDPIEAPFIEGEDGQQGWDVIKDEVTDKFTEALEDAGVDVSEITDENGRIDLDKLAENPDVLDALSSLETPLEVVVNMNGATELPSEIISLIAGKNIDLTLEMGEGILWIINGNTVTSTDIGDIDLGVNKGSSTIPVDVVNEVTGERYSIQLEIAHEGDFGFTATLSVNMEEENAGYYANLFYYNVETAGLEFVSYAQIDTEGNAALEFTHASAYTIVVSEEPMSAENLTASKDTDKSGTDGTSSTDISESAGTMEEESNDTGAFTWLFIAIVAIFIIAAGIYFVTKRKKEE